MSRPVPFPEAMELRHRGLVYLLATLLGLGLFAIGLLWNPSGRSTQAEGHRGARVLAVREVPPGALTRLRT